jgi:hypothetical protein
MRRLLAISLLFAIPSTLAAQRMGFSHFSGRPGGFHRSGSDRAGFNGYGPAAYYPLFDPFFSDYPSDVAYPAAPQPMVFMMQAAAPPAPDPTPPSQPLMIELQGGRYVQVSGNQPSRSQVIDRVSASQPPVQSAATTVPQPQPVSTILVFRDGHRQEISAYTIADATLYAAADYYNSGAWNQKIALSSLNLPETVAANHSRGVQFRLPSSPNEVIVGP